MSSPYQAYPDPHSSASNAGPASNVGSAHDQSSYAGVSSDNDALGPPVTSAYSPNLSPHFSSSAALLTLLALINLYEGTLRVIVNSSSQAPWTGSKDDTFFPALPLLIGGVWESFYALITLFVSLWALIFDWHSVALTTIALCTQMVGWYTVLIFGVAQPAFEVDKYIDPSGQLNLLSNNERRAATIFGWILSLLAVDTAILAGIILFTVQLLQVQLNKADKLHSPFYYARRLKFWSVLQFVLGSSQIIFASILMHSITKTQLAQPINFYPNLTTYPEFPLVTGALFFLLFLVGIVASVVNKLLVSNVYIALGGLTCIWIVAGHVMAGVGLLVPITDTAGYGMSAMGVLLGTALIPMYLSYRSATIDKMERGLYRYGPAMAMGNRPLIV